MEVSPARITTVVKGKPRQTLITTSESIARSGLPRKLRMFGGVITPACTRPQLITE